MSDILYTAQETALNIPKSGHLMNACHKLSMNRSVSAFLACVLLVSNGKSTEPNEAPKRFSLQPELGLEIRYDDNIYRSASSVESSWITMISPALSVSAKPSKHRFEFQYRGDIASYSESTPDNYTDHFFDAGAYFELGQRSKFDIIALYDNAHEDRGTGLTEGFNPAINIPPDPDEYQLGTILGRFGLGSGTSKGRVILEAGSSDLEYTNHLDRTRFFNRGDQYGNATFYYRVMPKTSLLLDVRHMEIDYQYDRTLQPSLDSKEYRYLFGAMWDQSAKVKGTVKVGYVQKNFDDITRGNFSGPSWEINIRLSPRTYSHLEFRTARSPTETNGTGNYIDNITFTVTWKHKWTNRMGSLIEARYLDQDFVGSTLDRKQEFMQYELSLGYQMRRWLSWAAGIELNARNSNVNQFEFDGNIYRFSVLMAF